MEDALSRVRPPVDEGARRVARARAAPERACDGDAGALLVRRHREQSSNLSTRSAPLLLPPPWLPTPPWMLTPPWMPTPPWLLIAPPPPTLPKLELELQLQQCGGESNAECRRGAEPRTHREVCGAHVDAHTEWRTASCVPGSCVPGSSGWVGREALWEQRAHEEEQRQKSLSILWGGGGGGWGWGWGMGDGGGGGGGECGVGGGGGG